MEEAKKPKLMARRELLKLGAKAGLAIPVVMSLAPEDARAQGSWKGGSSKKNDWRGDTREQFEMRGSLARDPNQGFAFPGSYEWREKKREEEERRRAMRGEFSRFGSSGEG
jgi:hypothetical protein